jgi:hypothetical protein
MVLFTHFEFKEITDLNSLKAEPIGEAGGEIAAGTVWAPRSGALDSIVDPGAIGKGAIDVSARPAEAISRT